MKRYTDTLVDFVVALKYKDLPSCVIEQTKLFIADYYAASIAGYRVNKQFNKVVMSIIKEDSGTEQASILFEKKKYPVANAAFMNAVYAHGADMDDGNRKSAGHIGAHVISSVFALGEKLGVTWKDIIVAINVGYEFFNRIAGAAQPGLYNRGFHSTGIAGAMACGAACAKLMGLDRCGVYNSVSLAAIQSSGLIIIDESGQRCKPINPANAARIGVLSALMAEKGLLSSQNPLESKKGWFHAFTDHVDETILLGGLGVDFTICESYLKLYPTCRHTHCCIDSILKIRERMGDKKTFLPDIIEKIEVNIYPSAIKSAGIIRNPRSQEEAKFSIYYAIAVAFNNGDFSIEDLQVERIDSVINDLLAKIELVPDPLMEDRACGIRGSRIKVVLCDGEIFEETILIPKGEGIGSLDWNNLRVKMYACSYGVISEKMSNLLINRCMDIDVDEPFGSIMLFFDKDLRLLGYKDQQDC